MSFVWWMTGLSGSGKSTLAMALANELRARGKNSYVIDGDDLRKGLSNDLGFSEPDRFENNRRASEVALMMTEAGVYTCVALISPFERDRNLARMIVGESRFGLIHVATPLEICEARDSKGLYAKARAGKITGFTGIDDPYESPETPRWRVVGANYAPEELAKPIIDDILNKPM